VRSHLWHGTRGRQRTLLKHPEQKPPQSIKRLVQLFRLHEEDKARREAGYESDDSSGLFYSSDESVEYSSDIYEGLNEKESKGKEPKEREKSKKNIICQPLTSSSSTSERVISSSNVGIRIPNCFIKGQTLRDIKVAVLEDGVLKLDRGYEYGHSLDISLSPTFDGNDFLKALEEWLEKYA